MAIDFPNSPTNGQTFTVGNTTWTYDGSKWNKNAVTISGPTGPNPLVVQPGTPSTTNVLWLDTDAVSTNAGIPVSVVDYKGELLVGTAADTVGVVTQSTTNGDMLVVDTSTTSGLRWQGQANTGRNAIINGGFDVWQRGASFNWTAAIPEYGAADRWKYWHNGSTPGTVSSSRQTFTPGSAPIAGYEGQFFHRITTTTLGTGQTVVDMWHYIEDVRTFAGRNATVSFWVKTSGTFSVQGLLAQVFGSGGSSTVSFPGTTSTTSTSWQRYTTTINLTSLSGKTIGSDNSLFLIIRFHTPTNGATFDVWGVQLEQGDVATRFEEIPFGETLSKCQRYYYRIEPGATGRLMGFGQVSTASSSAVAVPFPVPMRIRPTALEQSGTAAHYQMWNSGASTVACSSVPVFNGYTTVNQAMIVTTVASGLTAGAATALSSANTAAYVAWSAEL